MRQSLLKYILHSKATKILLTNQRNVIMGQGGYITLVNSTNSHWRKTNQHSYQMAADQFSKMKANNSKHFLLSWTLTR
jgi:hypothetical protein